MVKKISIVIAVIALMTLSFVGGSWMRGTGCAVPDSSAYKIPQSALINMTMVSVSGKITAISGRTLSLTLNGENLDVPVKDSAIISKVFFVGQPKEGPNTDFTTQKIEFKDLAVGQQASVMAEVSKEGVFLGVSVSVIEQLEVK
jgi:hypothetical protein